MATVTLQQLKAMLVDAKMHAVCDTSFIDRMTARDNVRKLKSRIARREKDQAMRDLGLVKVRGNLGGTYYE